MNPRDRTRRSPRSSWWHWPLLILGLGLCIAQVTIFALGLATGRTEVGGLTDPSSSADGRYNPVDAFLSLQPLMWSLPGVVILRKADWHPVGWALLLCGIGFGFSFDLSYPVLWDDFVPLSRPWAAWIADGWAVDLSFIGIVVLLSVFPDGFGPRGSSIRHWRAARVVLTCGLSLTRAFHAEVGGFEGNTFPVSYRNPTGLGLISTVEGSVGWIVSQAAFVGIVLLLVSSLWALRRRSRSVDPLAHRQYTWVLFPFGALFGGLVFALAFNALLGDGVWLPVVLTYLTIPVAFSIAMVRYQWFDIDRLVSRTVTYAVLAAAVVTIYAVPVLVLPELLGLSSDLAVAGATLAAAAAFSPLRREVQSRVDRRFNRTRYDAEHVVERLAAELQSATDVDTLSGQVGSAVSAALGPRTLDAWFVESASNPRGPST